MYAYIENWNCSLYYTFAAGYMSAIWCVSVVQCVHTYKMHYLIDLQCWHHQPWSSVHTSNNVEATYDFVAKKRQQRQTSLSWNLVLSTKSKQTEHVQFVSTLSNKRNFVRHCCRKRQQCRSNVRLCRQNRSTCSIRQCCFDIVAGVDGAWLFTTVECCYTTTQVLQDSILSSDFLQNCFNLPVQN